MLNAHAKDIAPHTYINIEVTLCLSHNNVQETLIDFYNYHARGFWTYSNLGGNA